ncbi:MAG: glycosyltransferase family 4 protein [Planctomycetota bacterium]|nr:glycosyltransferase family 4 protein [Planctomycetota bacterium]
MRPQILHLIDELKVGGAQTHVATMLREALRSFPQIRHRVISLFGDGATGDGLRGMGVEVLALDLRPYLAARRFFSASGVLRDIFLKEKPDIVEAHLTWSRLLGLYAAWRAGVPLRIGFEQGDIYFNSLKFRAANFIGQFFAHRIIVCSRALGEWVHRTHGVFRRRIAVFHNCVDTEKFRPAAGPEDIADFPRPECSTLFCAVGSLGRGVNKRVDVSIRAVAAARAGGADVGLVICGDGEQRPELERLAEDLGVSRSVVFLGTRGDVERVMRGCDAFCHAAPFEPFGIVCIEAMATGLPAIVPDAGGIVEAVDDGATGLVYNALDHEALADAMAKLHASPDLRRQMGASARKVAEERFSVRSYMRRLYAMYGIAEGRDS